MLDRDSIFSADVMRFINAMGTTPHGISYRRPWQNPVAQRWIIGSCRCELPEPVVVLGHRHLVRVARSYINC